MRHTGRNLLFWSAALCIFALVAHSQDAPQSLGDVARKTRQQKQSGDPQDKTKTAAKKTRVITDDEVQHSVTEPAPSGDDSSAASAATSESPAAASGKVAPEQWKSRILSQKNAVNSLQSNIDKLNESIQFAPGNCVANCVQWNERQKQKQAEVERMQAQLKDQQKRLEDMQEAARQQGYGSSITDP